MSLLGWEQKGNEVMLHAKAMNPFEAYFAIPQWEAALSLPIGVVQGLTKTEPALFILNQRVLTQ